MSYTEISPVRARSINPRNNNNVLFYWDELHNKDGKERERGRMITAAVSFNPKTMEVRYGATIFRKDSLHESWVRQNHRWTSQQRLEKRPVCFTLNTLDKGEMEEIIHKWTKILDEDDQLIDDAKNRAKNSSLSMPDLKKRIIESHLRDYVLERLKNEVRSMIVRNGTCGERIK